MATHAYDEDYLNGAQRILGDAVDFAVMSLDIDPDTFGKLFAVSDTSKQFALGNPKYIAGMNGCELARKVLTETHASFIDTEDAMFLDKGPEFWAGWALAYYQWYSSYSFMDILLVVSLEKIIEMYHIYHEMDIMQFVDKINEEMKIAYPQTRLKLLREACGFSQSELGIASGIPLRQIQLFEQRQRNINKTAAETLLKLSKTLCCKIEDLIEK
jgi:DNA-binding transcriptional regulator YiaG